LWKATGKLMVVLINRNLKIWMEQIRVMIKG
jgi:hypothetical protein